MMQLCLVRDVRFHEVTASGALCSVVAVTEGGVMVRETAWFESPPQEGEWAWLYPDPTSAGDPYTFDLDEV